MPEEEINKFNKKYEDLLKILKAHNIKVIRSSPVENGLIADLLIFLKQVKNDSRYRRKEPPADFEITSNVNKNSRLQPMRDDEIIPQATGFSFDSPDFQHVKLKKHEIEMVIRSTPDILKIYDKEENVNWLVNFITNQNNTKPLEEAINSGVMDSKSIVEEILNNRRHINAMSDAQLKKVIGFLSTTKIMALDLERESRDGIIPKAILETPPIFNRIMKNWEFTQTTGRKILMKIVDEVHVKAFKKFVTTKSGPDYYFDQWFQQEAVLRDFCSKEPQLLNLLVKDGWLHFSLISMDNIAEFFNDYSQVVPIKLIEIMIKEYFKHNNPYGKFIKTVLIEIDAPSEELTQILIDNANYDQIADEDLMIRDGIIMKYLEDYPDDHPLKVRLISSEQFVSYLLDNGKGEYLPEDVRDIFIF